MGGYKLSGPFNGAQMLDPQGPWARCPRCGFLLDRDELDPEFSLDIEEGEVIDYGTGEIEEAVTHADAKRVFDFSYTYDLRPIVSARFRDAVLGSCSTPVQFADLPREAGFFVLRPIEELEWDVDRAGSRFGERCRRCGQHAYAVGPGSSVRHPDRIEGNGIYRSDVEFGDGDEKHPLVIVGDELGEALRSLAGVVLHALEP